MAFSPQRYRLKKATDRVQAPISRNTLTARQGVDIKHHHATTRCLDSNLEGTLRTQHAIRLHRTTHLHHACDHLVPGYYLVKFGDRAGH
jgi:hypothetical protein